MYSFQLTPRLQGLIYVAFKNSFCKIIGVRFILENNTPTLYGSFLYLNLKVSKTYTVYHLLTFKFTLLIDNNRIMTSAAIFNRLPGAGIATNKAKFARIFKRM